MTEQHLYTSWYTSLENLRDGKFPETTVFPRSSLHYQAMSIDMDRRAFLGAESLVLTPDLRFTEFVTSLEGIFQQTFEEEEINALTLEYWKKREDFMSFRASFSHKQKQHEGGG